MTRTKMRPGFFIPLLVSPLGLPAPLGARGVIRTELNKTVAIAPMSERQPGGGNS